MIVGLGTDLVGIARIRRVWERHGGRFADRLLHPAEREHCLAPADPAERLAGRWAVKEAAFKALGTGAVMPFSCIALVPQASGAPRLVLDGPAAEAAARLGATAWHASLTHSDGMALAVVVLER